MILKLNKLAIELPLPDEPKSMLPGFDFEPRYREMVRDVMDGGGGPATDYAGYWFAEAAITANLMTNSATGEGNDTLNEFEGLLGTINYNDNLIDGNTKKEWEKWNAYNFDFSQTGWGAEFSESSVRC